MRNGGTAGCKKKRLIDEFNGNPRLLLAYTLAAFVAHTTDVDEMLTGISPEQMDKWEAFNAIVPIGSKRVFDTLSLIGSEISAGNGGKAEPSHFTPWLKETEREPTSAEKLAEVRRNAVLLATGV